MSAILRALKKIDSAPPAAALPNRPWPAPRPPARGGRDFFIAVAACLATGITTAAALYIYGPPPAAAPSIEPAAPPGLAPARPPVVTAHAATGEPAAETTRPPRGPELAVSLDTRQPAASPPESANPPNNQPAAPVPSPLLAESAAVTMPAMSDVPEKAVALLENSSLKLQALSWSEIPQKRLAVISNHIVREGAAVDGYTLVTINVDDVIVRKHGQFRRLIFGH